MFYTITDIPPNHGTISLQLDNKEVEDEDILFLIEESMKAFSKTLNTILNFEDKKEKLERLEDVWKDLLLFSARNRSDFIGTKTWKDVNLMTSIISEELLMKYSNPNRKITTFNTKVVGTTFRVQNGVDLSVVEDGDFVYLDPEVANPADDRACRVIHDNTGTHIGYVKRELAKEIWENTVYKGDLYLGKVEVTGGTEGKNIGFNLEVRRVHIPQEETAS